MHTNNTPRLMDAKFRGRCTACGQYFPVGARILWSRDGGAQHAGTCPAPAAPVAAPEIPVVAIAAFLTAAKARGLKAPKARFLAPHGGELRLSMAGHGSRYPGAVQVKINDGWIGRIGADNVVAGPLVEDAAVLAALDTIAANPAAAAKAYGALMGRCSFCDKPLTDAGSIAVGYGPVCAARWGLEHKALGTPTLAPVVAVPAVDEPVAVEGGEIDPEYDSPAVAATIAAIRARWAEEGVQ